MLRAPRLRHTVACRTGCSEASLCPPDPRSLTPQGSLGALVAPLCPQLTGHGSTQGCLQPLLLGPAQGQELPTATRGVEGGGRQALPALAPASPSPTCFLEERVGRELAQLWADLAVTLGVTPVGLQCGQQVALTPPPPSRAPPTRPASCGTRRTCKCPWVVPRPRGGFGELTQRGQRCSFLSGHGPCPPGSGLRQHGATQPPPHSTIPEKSAGPGTGPAPASRRQARGGSGRASERGDQMVGAPGSQAQVLVLHLRCPPSHGLWCMRASPLPARCPAGRAGSAGL